MEEDREWTPTKKVIISPEAMARKSHFSADEVSSLQGLYQFLTSDGKMDRLRFRDMMHSYFDMTDDVMLDRIFRSFDTNNDAMVDEAEFIVGLSIFVRGTLDEQINFAYFCYDINGDRSLARDELFHCLKNCLIRTSGIEEDIEESVKEIVEIAMRKLDTDKNGQITFPDFQAAVQNDPLLLEACGPCLPTPKAIASFFITLNSKFHQPQNSRVSRSVGQGSNNRRKMRRSSSYSPLIE